jgi:hypothetical protein
MKKINIIYWVSTILLCLVMGGGAIPDVINTTEAKQMLVGHLHYPGYFTPFIGVAKLLGAIAILVPGNRKLKEWAYAGFTFDLIGATYSAIAVGDAVARVAPMLVFFAVLAVSYIYHHKRMAAKQVA